MRWKMQISTLALLLGLAAGCKQQCYLTECDHDHYQHLLGNLEFAPNAAQVPASVAFSPPPKTVLNPERPARYISLAECVALALEHGTVGSQALNGAANLGLVSFQGRVVGADAIRVLALDPTIAQATLEASLSKFDAVWQTSMSWNVTDRPIGTALDAFQAGRSGALNAIQTDAAQFQTSLLKPLPTGGIAGITFGTQYQFTNLPARVNPAYTPSLQFQFEQPLLRGFGVEINQLLAAHPGSVLTPGAFNQQPTPEGILISRVRFDQQRAEFERQVASMLLNVEQAYWNLYSAYWNLYAREQALRLAHEFYRVLGIRFFAGVQQVDLGVFAQARGQYETFRLQRIQALGQVLEFERQLRTLLGLPAEDDTRLVPSDTPTLAPYQPDWEVALSEALSLRPELVLAREEVKVAQFNVIAARNNLLPDLRFTSTYGINAIGSRLDGPDANNALRNLADNDFNNYSVGLRLNVPLGYRNAHANIRIARLSLGRSFSVLRNQELKATEFLAQQYARLFEFYEQIRANRARREAYGTQLRVQVEVLQAGGRARQGESYTALIQSLLTAQQFYTDALANEYNAISQYNNALASFEYAKGTMLYHNNIIINEGPLPACAQERAAAHAERRTRALVAELRKEPIEHCGGDCDWLKLPELPKNKAVALPALLEGAPDIKDTLNTPLPPIKGAPSGLPAMPMPTKPGTGEKTGKELDIPGPRPSKFGASQMMPPSVTSRDSAPSLAPSKR